MMISLASVTALGLAAVAEAQRPPPSPEQRIDRLERQVQQMQRQVFPRGRPADTAGFVDDPAASQSAVTTLDQRLNSLERQMSDILRQSEENSNALRTAAADAQRVRDEQQQRIVALEQRLNEALAAVAAAPVAPVADTVPTNRLATAKPSAAKPAASAPLPAGGSGTATAAATPATDPAEDAYTEGFKLWESGQYQPAITSLRAFVAAYPRHRRASYANNLIGRALLDQGQARAAAEALLANYRNNPGGERAADSLYYLGQALMRLGQPSQACKAYEELDSVYGSKVRADLRKQVDEAKGNAKCA